MAYVILSSCIDVKDGACADVCPVDCIFEGEKMYYIHPSDCISCGLCESICPVDAIRHIDDVPIDEMEYVEINEKFFANGMSCKREEARPQGLSNEK
jgi:ferredoxin